MADDKNRFDWNSDENRAYTIVPEQRPIAVYWNPRGALVIRQQADEYEPDDSFIVVQPAHIPDLIRRLQAEIEEDTAEGGGT